MSSKRCAVFIDRDGVLNELAWDAHTKTFESPVRIDDVSLIDGAAAAIVRVKAAGLPVVVVSNQPSAAKGLLSVDELRGVHAEVLRLLAEQGAEVDASYLCLHHPSSRDPELGGTCDCRKPAPGLLVRAATALDLDLPHSWMIGDTDADVGAARAAGTAGVVLVTHPRSRHRRRAGLAEADATVTTTSAAVDYVLGRLEAVF